MRREPSREELAFLLGRRQRLQAMMARAESREQKLEVYAEQEAYAALVAETYDSCRLCTKALGDLPKEPRGPGVTHWILWDLRLRGYCDACAAQMTNPPPGEDWWYPGASTDDEAEVGDLDDTLAQAAATEAPPPDDFTAEEALGETRAEHYPFQEAEDERG